LSQHLQQKEEENGNQFLERENTSGHLASPRVEGLLKGQVAIITGSGQGIGEAAAYLFASEGSKVVVTDLDGGNHFLLIYLRKNRCMITFTYYSVSVHQKSSYSKKFDVITLELIDYQCN
jgi:glutamate dehydrogenase/leucine dehydrogenase